MTDMKAKARFLKHLAKITPEGWEKLMTKWDEELVREGHMRGDIEDHPTIKAWARQAKAIGACIQCQHPWYDGMCSCGRSSDFNNMIQNMILPMVVKLHKEGWLFKDERTVARRMLKVKAEKETFLPKKKLQKLWE